MGFFWRAGVVHFYKTSDPGDNVNVPGNIDDRGLAPWRIIPVIVIEDPKTRTNVAAALMAGGTADRRDHAPHQGGNGLAATDKGEQPEMFAGCGTVLNVSQAKKQKPRARSS